MQDFIRKQGSPLLSKGCISVLDVKWSLGEDAFSFTCMSVPTGVIVTKRVVLSCIAMQFDPLGLFVLVTMTAKLLSQDLWSMGLAWDDPLQMTLKGSSSIG